MTMLQPMIVARDAADTCAILDPGQVRDALGLDARHDDWLEELAATGPPPQPVPLPDSGRAVRVLEGLGCRPLDAKALAANLPSPVRTPALWWLLERCYQRLAGDMGGIDYLVCRWPSLPRSTGAPGALFYASVFLALAKDVRRWHREHGVTRGVSRATLSDLGRSLEQHRIAHGEPGLSRQDWLTLHFRGALFEIGRLQFHRSYTVPGLIGAGPLFWYDRDSAEAMGQWFRLEEPIVGIHIPASGPLEPRACDNSLRRARQFFDRRFPDEQYRLGVCTSWLLDEQLAEYLPDTSNIVRFQRRFRLVPGARDDDEGVVALLFWGQRPRSLDDLSPRTTLESAVVTHLRAGRHWRIRTGWLEL